MSAAFRIPFTVSGAHVYLRIRRGDDFVALMHALPDVEFIGDVTRARMRLVRMQPRRGAETPVQRDPADRARARAAQADARERPADSGTREDGGGNMATYRRREERGVGNGAKAKPKIVRQAPLPASPDTFVKPPTRDQLMAGGRPVSSLSRGGV